MPSGAGHDAMIVARRMPVAMLFLRSPGGISHHPDESVLPEDVTAALEVGMQFLDALEKRHA
jgi:allantoate deiminase